MNIDDVEKTEMPASPIFVAIFDRQRELAKKYHTIEEKNGFYYPPSPRPVIDDAQFQHWIKGMFWRVHEEIAEALEQIPDLRGWKSKWGQDSVVRHFFEELSDALHFLAEVSIVVGLEPLAVQMGWDKIPELTNRPLLDPAFIIQGAARVTFTMGLAANTLKNKPWKTTQMPTDENEFREKLLKTWELFILFFKLLQCSAEDVWQLYHKKNMVNQFRQETRY